MAASAWGEFQSGSYFEVGFAGPGGAILGRFTSVTGLSMEVDYEVYNEGGQNYPRFFFKENKPQILVLEQGIVTSADTASLLMMLTSLGMSIPMTGEVILKDSFGVPQRSWTVVGAYIKKYVGPDLNSNQPALAVTRIELIHNGCF